MEQTLKIAKNEILNYKRILRQLLMNLPMEGRTTKHLLSVARIWGFEGEVCACVRRGEGGGVSYRNSYSLCRLCKTVTAIGLYTNFRKLPEILVTTSSNMLKGQHHLDWMSSVSKPKELFRNPYKHKIFFSFLKYV